MMAVEAMPTPAAVKPLAKREADFSDDREQRNDAMGRNRASERHGRRAEASGEAASAGPGGKHNYSSPDIACH
jgi:hypothetical protein